MHTHHLYSHTIHSGMWDTFSMVTLNDNSSPTPERVTISDAIHNWIREAEYGGVVRYRDACTGPHCNPSCPDKIILGVVTPYWTLDVQAAVLAAVGGLSGICVLVKLVLLAFSWYIRYRQDEYLRWLGRGSGKEIPVHPLPHCPDSSAISLACLNLRYSVKTGGSMLHDIGLSSSAESPDEAKRKMSIAAVTMETMEASGMRRGDVSQRAAQNRSVNSDISSHCHQCSSKNSCQMPSLHQAKRSGFKEIIRGISTYFNPGELVAIMGPSGCGKTTFLDLLAGRKKSAEFKGEIYVNSIPVEKVRDWYVANTGYVLQLATPYYEELTVRENLTLAAQMRLSSSLKLTERLERVEQVMMETGLTSIADTRIGCSVGGGLSGGQKRRLCVALQILGMPSLIFLDEPTSGLDASSSLELLVHLNRLAESNRTVILTIHQPRLEIFHMFDKIMLLCQGQVAYHGVPEKAYEVFINAYNFSSLAHSPLSNLDTTNPADLIMDMISSDRARAAILCYYQHTQEPQAVENAIEISTSMSDGTTDIKALSQMKIQRRISVFSQLSALETRAQKRATFGQLIYLPLIFIAYSVLLGTVYLQTDSPTSLVTGFGIFSCASGLFMFPIVYGYLARTLEIFSLEYADGVGSPAVLIVQTFIRFAALSVIPITSSCLGLYLLAVPCDQYRVYTFTQVAIFTLSLNHVWIALLVLVICTLPSLAHRISPVLSAITGFVGGFFVPRDLMPVWYRWLFYINPNYYAFSSMIRLLLETINLGCLYDSDIECYPTSPIYVLTYFNFHDINPYLHLVILLGMTGTLLFLSWVALTLRHSNAASLHPRCQISNKRQQSPEKRCVQKKEDQEGEEERAQRQVSMPTDNGSIPRPSEAPVEVSTSDSSSDHHHYRKADKSASPLETSSAQHPSRQSSFNRSTHSTLLQEGENHEVWRPGCQRSRYNRSRGTIADRQKSLLMRISSYRSSASGGLDATPEAGVGSWRTRERLEEEDREKRLSQWKKIEEDAMGDSSNRLSGLNYNARMAPLGDAGVRGEGRRPGSAHVHHHVLPCRDSSLFPSTPNLSSTYTSMPDMSGCMVVSHPPQSSLDGFGVSEGAPTESQTLPRRLHLCAERQGEELQGGGGRKEGDSTAAPQGALHRGKIERFDLEEESRRASWRLQRHSSSPHPVTPPQCHPSYYKRESFAEMVPIPEEETELSMSLHGRLPSSSAHGSPAHVPGAPGGNVPPSDKPPGGNALKSSSSSYVPSTEVPADENEPVPSPRGSRTHQGGVLLLPEGGPPAVHNLEGQDGISHRPHTLRVGGPYPIHNLSVGPPGTSGPFAVPQGGFNPIAIIGLQESPGKQPLAHVPGRGSPLIQTRQPSVAIPSRYSTCPGRPYKQTDV